MTVRSTEILRQKLLKNDEETRNLLATNIRRGLGSVRQILDFMEENIQILVTTRNYDRWGFIFREVLLCENQMEQAVGLVLIDLEDYGHTSNFLFPSYDESILDSDCEDMACASNISYHKV